jgi:hypothetical protein
MSRVPDDTMDKLRAAAQQFGPVGSLPDSLKGTKDGETEDKLLAVQAAVGEQIVQHAYAAKGSVNDIVDRVKTDQRIKGTIVHLIPGVSVEEAINIALRACAGCIDGAKVPRDKEMTVDKAGKPTTRPVTNDERRRDMEGLDKKCTSMNDPVYIAAVGIGPLDKKLRNGQEPTFDGIDPGLLEKRYQDYFRRFPRSTN